MSLSIEHDCPRCGEQTEFWRTASMHVQLGEKTKWRCDECGYAFVTIDGIDTSEFDLAEA
jgi:predicted RNA-binding Zn-ribbon protein involved in translation (DUF1610 family)